MLDVALLGAGRIGQVHARNIALNPNSRLVAVADVAAEAATTLAEANGAKVMEIADILADSSIDAVLVATSTDTHSELIEAANAAGKAVLCEKPVDLSLQRALLCQENTQSEKHPIMIGFNRRFDPNFAGLKAALDAGDIGDAELLSITSYDPAPPPVSYIKVSGGLFRDMMIHDIDIACWLFGSTPSTVSAIGSSLVDPAIGAAGDVDTAVVTLLWESGQIAVIKNSRRAAYGYDQRMELLGSKGLLSAGNVIENTVSKLTEQGRQSAKPEYFFLERYSRAFQIEWAAFVDGVRQGRALPTSLQDGINALAVAEAATMSATLGKRVRVSGTTIEPLN